MRMLGGTFQPRSPWYFQRNTSMARLLNVNDQITPKAYASPSTDDVAAGRDNGGHLQDKDQVDDAVAGAEARMRLAEPVGQHTVFGHAHQHAG